MAAERARRHGDRRRAGDPRRRRRRDPDVAALDRGGRRRATSSPGSPRQFDGTQIGEAGLLNDDIFGVLALHRPGRRGAAAAGRRLPAHGSSWPAAAGPGTARQEHPRTRT